MNDAASEIYGLGERVVARRSDPDTSHDAAASVSNIGRLQRLILWVFNAGERGMTDTDIIKAVRWSAALLFPVSDSGVRSRRCELVRLGRLKDSGRRVKLASGRKSIVWTLA